MLKKFPASLFCAVFNSHVLAVAMFISALFGFKANAQSFYHVKKLDLPAPFKYTEIRELTQDKDGFIWFTTSQGLWRFDGTGVQPFDTKDPNVPQSAVPDVIYAYNGYILIFFDYNEKCTMYAFDTRALKLNKYQISALPVSFFETFNDGLEFYDGTGQKWYFKSHALLKAEKDSRITRWLAREKLQSFRVDTDGAIYLFYNDKIARLKNGTFYAAANQPIKAHGTTEFKFTFAKDVYISSKYILDKFPNGFMIFDKKTLKKLFVYKGNDIAMARLLNDKFVLLKVDGAYLNADSEFFNMQRSPFTGQAESIKTYAPEINSDKTLVATNRGIYELIAGTSNGDNNKENDLPYTFFKNKSVRSVARLPNGKLYLGTYGGFYMVDEGGIHSLGTTIVYCMTQVNEYTLLLGTEGGPGFATLDTRVNKISFLDNPSLRTYGYCIEKDGDGFMAGTDYGIYRIKKQATGLWRLQNLFHADSIGFVKQIKKIGNEWWIASATGLYKLQKNNTLVRAYPDKDKTTIYTMLPDNNGIWLGTAAKGLIKINMQGKVLNQVRFSNGLAGEFVYSLYKINGLIFAGTNAGLSVFDSNAGMQPIAPPDIEQYTEELNHSAIFYDQYRHQLILGGVQGLLFADMEHYALAKSKMADMVKLSYFKKGSNGLVPAETNLFAYLEPNITLYPGDVFMGLKFAGNNIWHQGKFLFRIPELESTWRKSDLNDEISFYSLSPGKYTLQARFASAADPHYWLNKTIIVVPHFYQTWYFNASLAAIVGLLVYMAWLSRLNKIRKDQQLRTTIASDLHDEIGSALTRISMSSELMHIKQQPDAKVIEHISDDSKNAIASISDIIWSIDARNDNKEDLLLRMRQHAFVMLEDNAEINFEATGLDKVVNLPQLIRQNIYLIFKEAINNIVKHNRHTRVWITLNNQPSGMTITIKNTTNELAKQSGYTGQGLKNMKMRAQRIKGRLDIVNADAMYSIIIRMKKW
jgi:signal transduction histidine kinase/ligand-binding sensor domain-containing protein